jgi:hypothetical protein
MALGLAAAVGLPNRAAAQTTNMLFYDDFESGSLANWTVLSGASVLDISTAANVVPNGGTYSAYLNSSLDKMYHNLYSEVAGWSVFGCYLYDSNATRAYAEVRGYTGAGYNQGTLQNYYAIGKYNSTTMPGEAYNATKYQGRVAIGPGTNGWFNLNLPGAPSRSPGWHRFDIVRTAGGVYNFYVDGVLGRSFTNVTDCAWDCVTIGSVAAGSTAGDAWFDAVLVGTIEPPPEPLTITGIVPSTLGGACDITYTNGSGSQFILLTASQVTEPMTNWVPVATNKASPGTFSVVPTADAFYRIQAR